MFLILYCYYYSLFLGRKVRRGGRRTYVFFSFYLGWFSTPNVVSIQSRYEEKIIAQLLREGEEEEEEEEEEGIERGGKMRKELVQVMVKLGEEDKADHEEGREGEGRSGFGEIGRGRRWELTSHFRSLKDLRAIEVSYLFMDLTVVILCVDVWVCTHLCD